MHDSTIRVGKQSVAVQDIDSIAKARRELANSTPSRVSFFIYHLLLLAIYSLYSVYRSLQYLNHKIRIKFLNLAYNPSKTPQIIRDDVNKLEKLPKRISSIMNLKSESEEGGGYYGLLNDSAELVTWTLAAGVQTLSIFEADGVLKQNVEDLRVAIYKKLTDYFGSSSIPTFVVKIPHQNGIYYGLNNDDNEEYKSQAPEIEISLISAQDGKPTIVELARTMAELAKSREISAKDVTIDLINKELTELIGVEPDLIILFTPILDLQGYPPWHIRLSEFYWEPDNDDVTYAIFLRALQKYATCKINVGK
jgi:dehydrodolichyl diphosphate syntase complex subunit NUS1